MEENTTDILRTKLVLNFALSLVLKGGKNSTPIYPALKVLSLISNDSLTPEEFKAKNHF